MVHPGCFDEHMHPIYWHVLRAQGRTQGWAEGDRAPP